MIEKIEQIKDFGIYKNFSWNSASGLKDFNHKNLFYGWNYSGKTTLSRIFSSLRDKKTHNSYDKSFFKVNTSDGDFDSNTLENFPFEILVFNSDYIKDNLNFSIHKDDISESKTILFEVGDNAKFEEKIIELKNKIDLINGTETILGKKEKYLKTIDDFEIYDRPTSGKFTHFAKEIKIDHFGSEIDFTKANLKPIISKVKEKLADFIITDKKKLAQLKTIVLSKEPRDVLNEISFVDNYEKIIKSVNDLMIKVPDKKQLDKILDSSSEIYSWVKKGEELHTKKTRCLFCDNDVKPARIEYLSEFFNSEASRLKENINNLKSQLLDEENNLKQINFPSSSNDLNLGYIDEYKHLKKELDKALSLYKKHLKTLITKLDFKLNKSLHVKVDEIKEFNINQIITKVNQLNNVILENNNFSKGFKHRIDNERNIYKNHLIASFLKREKYFDKEKKYNLASVQIEKLNALVSDLEKQIQINESKKVSDAEGALQYTYFIQSFLNRDDIEIKFEAISKKFLLLRGKENASNLSEGEKTAIAFSHFLVSIQALNLSDKFKNYIVFVDDPISSLDGNHIFQINSLIKETFFSQIPNPSNPKQIMWKMNCKQLFISTHNFEFMNLMKELPKGDGYFYVKDEKKCKESRYFIERKGTSSTITKIPTIFDDFKSEYHYLFSVITSFNNDANKSDSDKLLLMPNVLRRFVEMYTLAKYPSKEEVDDRANIVFGKLISKRILKPLNYFSHYNNIDNIGKQNELIADLPIACSTLIEYIKTKDENHFKALNNAIS
ncbi:AAA family ATPase [Flavobacterium ponti]|uniref:AAA family ATPase n=1 Tax=Flavobacterium ponti TaxID=665133 RepID=A0ABV9P0I0_9FLAO